MKIQVNVILNSNSKTKKQLFLELAEKGYELGIAENIQELEQAFWAREQESSTGMEFGFAIPHAKIDSIIKPLVIVVKTNEPISDYQTFDETKVTNVIALLVPKKDVQQEHVKILSNIATKLSNKSFRDKINHAKTKQDIVTIINADEEIPVQIQKQIPKNNLKIVGITCCTAGVAHTFIAKNNLVKEATAKGYAINIETHGASGPETILTTQQIKESDVVIIASDIVVDTSRFIGKMLYRTPVVNAVKNAAQVIDDAMKKATKLNEGNLNAITTSGDAGNKKHFLSHIMNGVSWMIPLLVATAILLAIPNIAGTIVGQSDIVSQGKWEDYVKVGLDSGFWKFMNMMMHIGWKSISLMFPIFAAFTAYSIGNKPAFIPGLIGGFLAKPSLLYGKFENLFAPNAYPFLDKASGFWGALIIGIVMGYIIKVSVKYIKVHKSIVAIKPMLILPFIGSLLSLILMVLVINPAFGLLNEQLIKLGEISGKSGKYVLALVIAPMTASDLGGPINKAAYTGMLTFYETRTVSLTMRVIPTITPSIGLGLAALIDKFIARKRVFDDDVRMAAPNSILLACLGISEGGLPFLFKRPFLTLPVNMLGGIVGAYVGILTGTEQWFPDSAIWAWPFAKPVWGLLLGIAAGSLSTMLMHIYLRLFLMKIGKLNIDAQYNKNKEHAKIKKIKTKN